MSATDRGAAMASSLARAARSLGVTTTDVDLVARAHARAMAPRMAALDDDHHPSYLHPGRAALVLLRDAAVKDGSILAAACLAESEEHGLGVPPTEVRAAFGPRVAALADVPAFDSEELAERLVTAGHDERLVALAERLDTVRHAHVRDLDRTRCLEELERVRAVYLPVAERTDERLARRFRHWSIAFARRLRAD